MLAWNGTAETCDTTGCGHGFTFGRRVHEIRTIQENVAAQNEPAVAAIVPSRREFGRRLWLGLQLLHRRDLTS